MKVFISHKQEDYLSALLLKRTFDRLNIDSYIDVLDSAIAGGGQGLTEHIKQQLNNCTDIIVVMSEATKLSWWVPFENWGVSASVECRANEQTHSQNDKKAEHSSSSASTSLLTIQSIQTNIWYGILIQEPR